MAPELMREFNWSAETYTSIVLWFQVGYAVGFIVAGKFFDLLGTRLGFAIAVCCWSVAATWHSGVSSVFGFKFVRLLLGVSEPSHMPGGIKVVAEWFPRSERALATGIFKSGSNLGAIIAPLLVPWLYLSFGWRFAFLITASTGFLWLVLWLWLYRPLEECRRVSDSEREHIRAGQESIELARVSWRVLLSRRETWAYMNFKFMTDAVWHWYLAMMPLFLHQKFDLGLHEFGLPLVAIYLIADFGSIGGGWLSSHWIMRGMSITRARKISMLICCACTFPVVFMARIDGLWGVVLLAGLAHAAHQGLTSNLFSTVSDLFPRSAVASVVGFGGTAGQVGAAIMMVGSGVAIASTGSLSVMFFVAGTTYLVAFVVFHLLVPHLGPIDLSLKSG